jgi:hypothetical protein
MPLLRERPDASDSPRKEPANVLATPSREGSIARCANDDPTPP